MPLTADVTVVTDLAQAVLTACEQGLTADGIVAPTRRYVEAGLAVPYDVNVMGKTGCEMLVVACVGVVPVSRPTAGRQDGHATRRAGGPNPLHAIYETHAVICYPSADQGGPPSPDVITAASERMWSLAFSARRGVVASGANLSSLQPSGDSRATTISYDEVGELTPIGPAGGVAAVKFRTTCRI